MNHLYLIRHGRTAWNAEHRYQGQADVPLDDEGRRQARLLAARLRGAPIDVLYTSDLVRAAETADLLGTALGLAPIADAGLREIHCGDLEGLLADEIEASWPGFRERFHVREASPQGGETIQVVHDRIVGAFDRLRAAHDGASVALVSHGFVLRVLCAHLFDVPSGVVPEMAPIRNTAITHIDFSNGAPRLELANDDSHAVDAG